MKTNTTPCTTTCTATRTKTNTTTRTKTNTNGKTSPRAADPDEPPADIDALRIELARRISRFVGDRRRAWRTCKEPTCRRHRCCRAPRIQCSNAPPPRPDPDGRRTARTMAQVHRTLRELQARQSSVHHD